MCDGELFKQEKKKAGEIHVPSMNEDINAQMPEAFRLQNPDLAMKRNAHGKALDGKIRDALQNSGPVHAVRFLPGSKTLTREYLGQLRANLADQQRLSKKTNVKSRLHKKNQNAMALNLAQSQMETSSKEQIRPLKDRFKDFDEETIKSLTYFSVNGNTMPEILDELTIYLFKIDIGNLHMESDDDLAKNAPVLEKLSCQMKAYDKLIEKNPDFLDSISDDVREKIETKISQLHTIAFYYDAKKAVMTDQYFIDHYNEELSMDVNSKSPEAQKKLAQKLVNTYLLGRRLLRVNGMASMEMLKYGFILPKNDYVKNLVSKAKQEYCQDENTGKYAVGNLFDAIRNLRAAKCFWGDSNEMKQVKSEVKAVAFLLNAKTKGRLLEEVKIPIIDALGRLERTCSMYVDKKVKDIRKDTSNRHLSVINIMEAARMARDFWEPLTQEKYDRLKPEEDKKTAADIMNGSGEQIERNDLEEEKTRRQIERNRHFEAVKNLRELNRAGSSFSYVYEHNELLRKLRERIPGNPQLFEDNKASIEQGYTELINACDRYLRKRHDYDRMIKVRELRQTYATELDRFKKLDFYQIQNAHAQESWEKCMIGGAVYVEKNDDGSYVTDDERTAISVISSKESIKDNCFIKAAKALGFESGMFKNYEEAFVQKDDGTYEKSVISAKEEVNKKWKTFGEIVWAAQDAKSNMVYSDNALRQLSSIQIFDELMGIRNRKLKSLKYLARIEVVIGEPTLIIDSVRIEEPILAPSNVELKDGEKGSIYDEKGNLRLPAYDRSLADKISSMKPEEFFSVLQSQGINLTTEEKNGFTKRYTKLKAALWADKGNEKGWRYNQELKEGKAARKIVSESEKMLEKYKKMGLEDDNGLVIKQKKLFSHYSGHPEFALGDQFVKNFDKAVKGKKYTGYARKEILTENIGQEKAFTDLTRKELGKEAYNKYENGLKNAEKKIAEIDKFKAEYKPESEKKRLSLKKQLLDDLTADMALQGMDEKFYSALEAFKNYALLDITGQDAYETVKEEKDGKTYERVRITEKKTHEEAMVLKNAFNLIKERLDSLPKDVESQEKQILEKYVKRYDEITGGRLKVPQHGAKVIKVGDDKFTDLRESRLEDWENTKKEYEWKQVDEPLFSHEPCVNDVVQGRVGNCYMLAALASLVEKNPSFIRNIMTENKKDNTVTVRFIYGKKPIYVTVSKSVPVKKDNKDVAMYASGALWVQMIEKAFVASGLVSIVKEVDSGKSDDEKMLIKETSEKGLKSYEHIGGGMADKFMQIITGNTCECVEITTRRVDNDMQFAVGGFLLGDTEGKFLSMAKNLNDGKSDKILTVSTRDDFELEEGVGLNGENMMRGIASNHAYTVLGCVTVGGEDMIMLRNPWGYGTVEAKLNKVTGAISIREAGSEYAAGAFMVPLDTFFFMFDHYSVMSVKSLMDEEKGKHKPKKKKA